MALGVLQRSAALALICLATCGHQPPMALDNIRASPAASLVVARSGTRPLWSMAASLLGRLPLRLVPIGQTPGSDIFQSALGCSVLGCPSTQLRWPLYVLILILTNARLRRSAAQALGLPTSRAWTRPLWCSTLVLSHPCPSVLFGDQLLWRPETRRSAAISRLWHSASPGLTGGSLRPVICARPLRHSGAWPLGPRLLQSTAAPGLRRVGS